MSDKAQCGICDDEGWLLEVEEGAVSLRYLIRCCQHCARFEDDESAALYLAELSTRDERTRELEAAARALWHSRAEDCDFEWSRLYAALRDLTPFRRDDEPPGDEPGKVERSDHDGRQSLRDAGRGHLVR